MWGWIFIGAVVLLCVYFYRSCYSTFQILKRSGIKGPAPSFFYGNYKDWTEGGIINFLKRQHQQHGPIVGFYLGQQPQISVVDIELIKLITIKDFDAFINRPPLARLLNRKPPGLLRLRDEAWRSTRHILSPTFSSHKLRAMTPIIQRSVEALVEVLQKHTDTNKSFEVFRMYGDFTMETILATAFGRVIDIQRGESDQLTEAAAAVFSSAHEGKKTSMMYLGMILSNLPWIQVVLWLMSGWNPFLKAQDFLYDATRRILEARRKESDAGKKYKDLLQLMMDATAEEVEGGNNGKKKLMDEEIIGNAMTFMLAGYETTANALAYTSYLLALNPHVQEKVQAEIDAYLEENPDASLYQASQDMEYLDMVLHEALRMYPPAPAFTRQCGRDYTYGDITIPKGTIVVMPSILFLKNPEYWKDPEEFDPMRFTAEEKAERPPQSYMPFGYGPRACIGMRFALLEAKLALIEVLKRFSFVRAPDTQVPLETVLGITMSPKHGIFLKLISREL